MIRLDKYLANMGVGTRTQVKEFIKKGRVSIDDNIIKSPETKFDENSQIAALDGVRINFVKYEYYMLNKPSGVVSATVDNINKTVISLINSKRKDLFPIGRLDKDTQGLIIITNDGEIAHKMLSPKHHISKVYYAQVEGIVDENDVKLFAQGLKIDNEFNAMPAKLEIIKSEDISQIKLEIFEGKFHQVKRMFEAVGKKVIFLKRISMGEIKLDNSLKAGEFRQLNKDELNYLERLRSNK